MNYVAFDRHGPPSVLHVAQRPVPEPRSGEVLIEVEAAGVSRADALQRAGAYPPPPGASEHLGLEVSGVVVEVGEGVDDLRIGDEVCALCNGGGYAEFVNVPRGQVLPMPQNWSFIEAATLPENAFTVYDNLFTRARLSAGETLLVHGGTSGIGMTAIGFARAFGARVIATAGGAEKCAACVDAGADAAIDYRRDDFVARARELTGGRGVDVVLDIVGGDYIDRDLQALAQDGRVAMLATSRGRRADIDIGRMLANRLTVIGSSLRARTAAQKAAIARDLSMHVWPRLPQRNPIAPVVDSVYTFGNAAQAHERLEESRHIGKIVLVPDAPSRPGGPLRRA